MPSPEIKTLVLRFRDLSQHDTIQRHRVIIAKEGAGSVWWGWWNKSGETVPDEAFRTIARAAAAPEGLEILLFDSDRLQIFSAHCIEVFWHFQHEKVGPRERPELAPDYYAPNRLAWFRFTSINPEPLPETHLSQYSYVEIPEFFEKRETGYQAFNGKRVASVEELRQQSRTIWFVRATKPEDPSHEILLQDPHRNEPEDFRREHIISQSLDLLWVSDLHFSEDGHHAFPLKPDHLRRSAWGAIEKSLAESGVRTVAGVIASGDFTWKAAPSEFDMARSFLAGIREWGSLKNYDFLVCPGNHDIPFSSDPADKSRPISVAADTARAAYESFYQSVYFKKPNAFLSCGRRFLLGGVLPVEICVLNSCLLDQKKKLFQGQGFIGDGQMEHAAQQLGWLDSRSPRALRILVLHHHLLPVTYREIPLQQRQYSITLDAEAVMQWALKHEVDLVLHGHQHQPYFSKVTRPIDLAGKDLRLHDVTIVGLGSTGVELDHLGGIKSNMFALLRFGIREVLFQFFSIHSSSESSQLLFEFRVDLSARNRLA